MAEEDDCPTPGSLRTLQIVVGAMTVGVAVFLIIVIAVVGLPGKGPDMPVPTYLAIAVAAAMLATRAIVPGVYAAYARRSILAGTWKGYSLIKPARSADLAGSESDAPKLEEVFAARTIAAAAMIESAALFSVVAYLGEHLPLSLGLAVVLLVALAAHVPTRSRTQRWIEGQMRLLEQERQFSRPT
jgi:hypothetical protein